MNKEKIKLLVKYDTNGAYIKIENKNYYINIFNKRIKLDNGKEYQIDEIISSPINTYIILTELEGNNGTE